MPVNLNELARELNRGRSKAIRQYGPQNTPQPSQQSIGTTPSTGINQEIAGRRKFLEGGPFSDIGDILNAPQSTIVPVPLAKGLSKITGKPTQIGQMSARESRVNRVAPSDVLIEQGLLPEKGAGRFVGGLAADIIADPLNLAAGLGAIGKGIGAVGDISKSVKLADIGSDIARFAPKLEPVNILAKPIKGAVGPVVRPVLEAAEKALTKGDEAAAITTIAPKTTGELARSVMEKVPGGSFFLKAPSEFREADVLRRGEIAVGSEKAEAVAEAVTRNFSKEQKSLISKLATKEIEALPLDITGRLRKDMETAAGLIRTNVDDLSQQLATEVRRTADAIQDVNPKRAAAIRKYADTVEANKGNYLIEQYAYFLENPKNLGIFAQGDKKTIELLAKNKDLPEEVKQALKLIEDPGFRAAKSIQDISKNVANSKFLRFVSDTFGTIARTVDNTVQLPDAVEYGSLAGKWVSPVIANEIKRSVQIGVGGIREALEKNYGKILNLWKEGKVTLNPAGQVRNFVSNMTLLDLAQYPVFSKRGVDTFLESATQLRNKGDLYKEALETGVLDTTFGREELLKFADDFVDVTGKTQNPIIGAINAARKFGRDAFKANEEFAKLALYIHKRNLGATATEASQYARKWLFDYSDIPEAVRFLRQAPFGYPFLTFTYKSVPLLAETAVKRPTAVSKYYKLFNNIEQGNRQQEEAVLPEYMENGAYVRLPFTNKVRYDDGTVQEQPVYLDLNYILPWGDVGDIGQTLKPGSDLVGGLTTALLSNKHPFFGTEIWKETDTDQQILVKAANFVYQTVMPSFAPEIPFIGIKGGYSWNKMASAIKKTPDSYSGTLRDIPETFLDVFFGLKTKPINVTEEASKRGREFRDKGTEIRSSIKKLNRDLQRGIINEKEYDRLIKVEQDKLQELNSGFGPNLQPR